jgi:hypothetical protein
MNITVEATQTDLLDDENDLGWAWEGESGYYSGRFRRVCLRHVVGVRGVIIGEAPGRVYTILIEKPELYLRELYKRWK